MGPSCYIGLEDADGTIQCIHILYDGYFGHIIPILRTHYMTRDRVELLIQHGDESVLLLPSELKNLSPEDEAYVPTTLEHKYKLEEMRSRVPYCYVYTKNNEWECHLSDVMKITG